MASAREGSIRLFHFAGVDVFLHWSWFLVAIYEIQGGHRRYSSVGWNIAEYLALFLIVTLHEFGHAMGFHHEHSHPVGGCELSFRWEDDPGYIPTLDQFGQFIIDRNGRRPGIYTVLGGPPNRWPQSKVDFNLRQLKNSHAYTVGPFDRNSIMKYYFGEWMFREGTASHCFSQRNLVLSEQDKIGMQTAYPKNEGETAKKRTDKKEVLEKVISGAEFQKEALKSFEAQLANIDKI